MFRLGRDAKGGGGCDWVFWGVWVFGVLGFRGWL